MEPICNTQNRNIKHSSFIALVEKIYNEDNKPQRYKGTTESMLREFFSKTSKKKYTWKRETFKNLLIHVYNQKAYAVLRNYYSIQILHNISGFGNKLVRPIKDWQNKFFVHTEQVSSLIQHCFAAYETPKFMESAFRNQNNLHMLWYVQLGSGKSVKSLSSLPVHLTSKMAYIFRTVPEHFSVNRALRYAQAKGLGATDKAADVIAASDLMIIKPEHEAFWYTVVQFFVKVECLSSDEIDHIVEYLEVKYSENKAFSMKGRTFNALLNQANQWHRKKHFENAKVLNWKASGIPALYVEEEVDGMKIVYKTIEIQNSFELYKEGEEMRHCVADYDEDCYEYQSAIFSLQKEVLGQPAERLATIEVGLPDLNIVQAKAKYNEEPCMKTVEMIDNWINSSTIKKNTSTIDQQEYQPIVYQRMVEREQMRTQNLDIVWVFRLIFWLLYALYVINKVKM